MQELIEEAKNKIGEEIEFQTMPEDMESRGVLAYYNEKDDAVYYSVPLMKDREREYQIQTFLHELCHVYDLRSCVRNGLHKVIFRSKGISTVFLEQADDLLHKVSEFQVSAFLSSKFGCQLPSSPKVAKDLTDEISFSLIPAIEYLHFGKDEKLKEEFQHKLNISLNSNWLSVESVLIELGLGDAVTFETKFPILAGYLGFKVTIKTESINQDIKNNIKILNYCRCDNVKVIELIDFDITQSIFWNPSRRK